MRRRCYATSNRGRDAPTPPVTRHNKMIESAWSIQIGLDNATPPTPARAWATLLEDYAAFRGRGLGRRASLRAALVLLALLQKPIRGSGADST